MILRGVPATTTESNTLAIGRLELPCYSRGMSGPHGGICRYCGRYSAGVVVHQRYCAARDVPKEHPRAVPVPIVGGPLHGTIHRQGKGPRPRFLKPDGTRMHHSSGQRAARWRHRDLYVLKSEGEGQAWYHWSPATS